MNLQTFTAEGLNNFRQEELRAAAKQVNADRVSVVTSPRSRRVVAKVAGLFSARTAAPAQLGHREVVTSTSR